MNFSEVFRLSGKLCSFSPDGLYVATAVQHKLVVRDARDMEVFQFHSCGDVIQKLEWSSDSLYVLCVIPNRDWVQVFSLKDVEWTCKIELGSWGCLDACWAPDSRHILTISKFYLNIMIWSLTSKTCCCIKYLKEECTPVFSFSPSGEWLCVAEKRDDKDCLSIYSTGIWQLVKSFEVGTKNLWGMQWSPDSSLILCWESPLAYYIQAYSLNGRRVGHFKMQVDSLGIHCVKWSPSTQFVAIGSYDGKLRVLNHLTWRPFYEVAHTANITDSNCSVYEEAEVQTYGCTADDKATFSCESKYETIPKRPYHLYSVKADVKGNPNMGVSEVLFSTDGAYLATKCDNIPNTVWVYEVQANFEHKAVLNHNRPVKGMCWDPSSTRLAICTGANTIYFWVPLGSVTVAIPEDKRFDVMKIIWNPSGTQLALLGRDYMRAAYFDQDDATADGEKDSDSDT